MTGVLLFVFTVSLFAGILGFITLLAVTQDFGRRGHWMFFAGLTGLSVANSMLPQFIYDYIVANGLEPDYADWHWETQTAIKAISIGQKIVLPITIITFCYTWWNWRDERKAKKLGE